MFSKFDLKKYLPWESRYLSVNGCNMHYFDVCDAADSMTKPVVVLLHGNPTWSFYYRNLIIALKSDYRVIAPDFIGMGLSDHPAHLSFRAVDRVNHLEGLIKSLGIERFSLVMHDWGGPIGTGLAVRCPEKIERLVYLNTTLTETECLPEIIKTAARPPLGRFITQYTSQFVKLTVTLGAKRILSSEIKSGYYYPYRTISSRKAIWDFVSDIPFSSDHPSYSELLKIASKLPELRNIPALIVWGLKDPCFHKEMLSQVAGHFPQARVVEIPEAGHLVLEDATEQVCGEIKTFLKNPGEPVQRRVKEVSLQEDLQGTPEKSSSLYGAFRQLALADSRNDAVTIVKERGREISYRHYSYGELLSLVSRYERGLTDLGLKVKDKVLMLVQPGADFLALGYAVMGRGAVPIFIDPGMGISNLMRCINDASPEAIICSPKVHALRVFNRGLFKRFKFVVTAHDWLGFGGTTIGALKAYSAAPLPEVNLEPEDTALIAFTSGATGTPKGVIFTNSMLEEQLRVFTKVFDVQCGKKDLPLLPVFSLFNMAVGVCSVFPPIDPSRPLSLDPRLIVRVIDDLGISYSFGSPSLWNKISDYCQRYEKKLPSLKKVFMAGAPVSQSLLAQMRQILPNGEAFTPYGATEALPVTLVSAKELLDAKLEKAEGGEQGTLVGKAVNGVELKIIKAVSGCVEDISEAIFLQPYQIGEVIVKGANVSPSYLNRPDANKNSKIKDGQGFWHRVGDVGYLDAAGNLYFCGRKVHLVCCDGHVWYSDPVENIFNTHPKVRRSALVGLFGGKEPAVVIEPLPEFWPNTQEAKDSFIEELKTLAASDPITAGISKFFFNPSFPVDVRHNAKIFRDKLGEWASQRSQEE